jgi:predicted nucleotidyltransferase
MMHNLSITEPCLLKRRVPADAAVIANLLVKERIAQHDAAAAVILFGSRARGDAEPESDWDFLVLSNNHHIEEFASELRKDLLYTVELPYNAVISLIVKNRNEWFGRYDVTPLFDSISKEGIEL